MGISWWPPLGIIGQYGKHITYPVHAHTRMGISFSRENGIPIVGYTHVAVLKPDRGAEEIEPELIAFPIFWRVRCARVG